jgi:predicted esterase
MTRRSRATIPWALERTGAARALTFGCSNGAAWAAEAVLRRPEAFAGALVFSLGVPPPRRGHDHEMCSEEFVPALRWVLTAPRGAPRSPVR